MRKLVFSLLSLVLILTLVIAACAKPAPEGEEVIKVGHITLMTGAVAMVGETTSKGVDLAVEQINERGGILGRKVVVIRRDTGGKPEKGVQWAKDLITVDKVDYIQGGVSSRTAFAIKEVSRDMKFPVGTISETSSYMADPKEFNWYNWRTGRQGVHDLAVGGYYVAKLAKEKGWTKFMGVNPDYAYGHEQWDLFKKSVKYYLPEAEFVGETWPKVFEPDMTPNINAVFAANPDAIFGSMWGPDAITFVKQGHEHGLFQKIPFFGTCLGSYLVVKMVPEWPAEGVYAVNRSLRSAPDTPEQRGFVDAYYKRWGTYPANWGLTCYIGMLVFEAAANKAGSLEPDALMKASEDLTIKSPLGVGGTITMRGQDHSMINYAVEWGHLIGEEPYLVDTVTLDWKEILKHEQVMWKESGWTK